MIQFSLSSSRAAERRGRLSSQPDLCMPCQKVKVPSEATGTFRRKRRTLKRRGGEADPSPSFSGGPMYDEATARKILKDAGFDPDSPRFLQMPKLDDDGMIVDIPMTHFCTVGDLKMCRYLLSKGALATQTWNDDIWNDDFDDINYISSPMGAAAFGGHVHICKWLCEHGGRGDIRMRSSIYYSPLRGALSRVEADSSRIRETYRWLILNEALCPNDDGIVEFGHVKHTVVRWLVLKGALCPYESSEDIEWQRFYPRDEKSRNYNSYHFHFTREKLEEWSERVTQPHASIITFLHGALPPTPRTDGRCILQCLSGHPGIRKNICGFVGRQEVTKKKHLHILRQVALPPLVGRVIECK